ncbi:uncharacterized protein Dwil_GK20734 [Drosophila willistoni]|uniref:Fatty acyl-CoA reductase C-terminal domain-containing protein n=2 Tax=Drosophila willistoni TaxID=7260 RepID=B4MJW9_DROWI|nr:uncharacterized protein Dwil_GK20734 [Drosophila willistoni]
MNGPTGVLIGAGKGVIRSMIVNGDLKSEVIPVDIAINGLILIPYHNSRVEKRPLQIPVYNLTVADQKKRTWRWVMDVGRDLGKKYPFEAGLWYPDGNMTSNKLYHTFCCVMFMWLPAYFIDFLLLIFGQRRFMIRVQNKISVGLEVLQFFTTRQWDFKSTHFEQIYNDINQDDKKNFKINTDDVDDYEYLKISMLGGRQYVMKEPLTSLPKARIQLKFLFMLDRICKTLILGSLAYWLSSKVGLIDFVRSNFEILQK